MFQHTNLTQEEIDWLIAHPELNALVDRLVGEFYSEAVPSNNLCSVQGQLRNASSP